MPEMRYVCLFDVSKKGASENLTAGTKVQSEMAVIYPER